MRHSLLLAPLLAIVHTALASPIPDLNNDTITIDLENPDINCPVLPQKQKLGGGDGFISGPSNYGAMQRQNGAWQSSHGFPFSATDKLFIMRYQEPNCQGKPVRKRGDNMKVKSEKHFKKWKKNQSMRYALPSNGDMSLVDISFWDRHIEKDGKHYCGGNVIFKLDGRLGETMDGDRYACHPIPLAKCMSVTGAEGK